jgi:hypothetical protein
MKFSKDGHQREMQDQQTNTMLELSHLREGKTTVGTQ